MKISLVVPVYNAERYLRKCIESLLNQAYPDWECICVDDGSTDGSGEILQEYTRKDRRMRVIRGCHAGVSVARNSGIGTCTGDYVGFLDADDALENTWLARVAQIIERHPVDVIRLTTKSALECGFSFLTFTRATLLKGLVHPFPVGMRLREDTIFLLRLEREASAVYRQDLSGYGHRDNPDSVVHAPQQVADLVRFVDEFIPYAGSVSLRTASRAIYISTLWWRVQRDRSEADAEEKVWAALDRAARANAFSYRYAPLLCGHSFVLADVYMGLRRLVNPQWLP